MTYGMLMHENFGTIHAEVHMGSKVTLSEICYISVLGMLLH